MPHDRRARDEAAIRDMLAAMHEAQEHVAGLSKETASAAPHPRDACLYRILVLGEAASRISDETRERYSDVPWSEVVGMRHVIIHGYEKVDWDVVWHAIHAEFEPLRGQLHRILSDMERERHP